MFLSDFDEPRAASETFYNAQTVIDGEVSERLCETIRPEVKRKIIGDTFMAVTEQVPPPVRGQSNILCLCLSLGSKAVRAAV